MENTVLTEMVVIIGAGTLLNLVLFGLIAFHTMKGKRLVAEKTLQKMIYLLEKSGYRPDDLKKAA